MHNIETLKKFLKDEVAATGTYQKALDKLRIDASLAESESLRPIYEAHKDAVTSLQKLISRQEETLREHTGTWAKLVQEGANLLGKKAGLKALQGGENNGAEDYEEALQSTGLSPDVRALIETKLLPAQKAHIRTLDRLLDATAA